MFLFFTMIVLGLLFLAVPSYIGGAVVNAALSASQPQEKHYPSNLSDISARRELFFNNFRRMQKYNPSAAKKYAAEIQKNYGISTAEW